MSQHDLRRGRAIMDALAIRRRLSTEWASQRGDLRFCYERMYHRRPDRIIRFAERVPITALAA